MVKSKTKKLLKVSIPIAFIVNILFFIINVMLLAFGVNSIFASVFVSVVQIGLTVLMLIICKPFMLALASLNNFKGSFKSVIKLIRSHRISKSDAEDLASDLQMDGIASSSELMITTRRAARRASIITKIILIVLTLTTVSISIMLSLYTFIFDDDSYMTAIIETILSKDKEKEEDQPYIWDFGKDSWVVTIEGETFEYNYEGDLLVKIALQIEQKYRDEGLLGGDLIWEWSHSLGGGFSKETADISGNGVYWSDSRGYAIWDWCSSFVAYCADVSGLSDSGNTLDGMTQCHYYSASGLYQFCVREGWDVTNTFLSNKPQPGDIVFYKGRDGSWGHASIFYKVEGDTFYTIEGNVCGNKRTSPERASCSNSIVKILSYNLTADGKLYDGMGRQLYIVHPNYKTLKTSTGGGKLTPDLLKANYATDENGYILDTQQVIYDVFVGYLGYSSEAACAIVVNNLCESARGYDVFQYNVAPVTGVSSGSSNGNWHRLLNGTVLNTPEEAADYWMNHLGEFGYGIVQWTAEGRAKEYLQFASKNSLPAIGPDSLLTQLLFVHDELSNTSNGAYNYFNILGVQSHLDSAAGCGAAGVLDAATVFSHRYEASYGCNGRQGPFDCAHCSDRVCGLYGSLPRYQYVWNKWGNTEPSIKFTGLSGGSSGFGTSFSNVTMIGDSNTVRMKLSNTAITGAKKIIAYSGQGINSSDIIGDIQKSSSGDMEYVCIMLGTNNYSYDGLVFKSLYRSLILEIKKINPSSHIILCTIPRVNDTYSSTIKDADTLRVSGWIKDIADSDGYALIDVNSYLDPADMSTTREDGYHLSVTNGVTKCADYITSKFSGSSGSSGGGGGAPVIVVTQSSGVPTGYNNFAEYIQSQTGRGAQIYSYNSSTGTGKPNIDESMWRFLFEYADHSGYLPYGSTDGSQISKTTSSFTCPAWRATIKVNTDGTIELSNIQDNYIWMTVNWHLEQEVKEIMKTLYDNKVILSSWGGYADRTGWNPPDYMNHTWGFAIDLNAEVNAQVNSSYVVTCGYGWRPVGFGDDTSNQWDANGRDVGTTSVSKYWGILTESTELSFDPNGVVVQAFKAHGWSWGGEWGGVKDFMHFSVPGG